MTARPWTWDTSRPHIDGSDIARRRVNCAGPTYPGSGTFARTAACGFVQLPEPTSLHALSVVMSLTESTSADTAFRRTTDEAPEAQETTKRPPAQRWRPLLNLRRWRDLNPREGFALNPL